MRSTLILALGLLACNPPEAADDTGDILPDDALRFTDANNYSITANIDIGNTDVRAGADSTIDWCGLTTDLRGRPVDLASVDQVLLVEFAGLTQAEIEDKIDLNDIMQDDSASQWTFAPNGTCTAEMSEFEVIGNVFDPADYMVENEDRVWLVSVANSEERLDILMSTFVTPLDGVSATSIPLTDSASSLTIEADLHSAPPILAVAGTAPVITWQDVGVDVTGKPFDNLLGDRLLLGKVPASTVEEVEDVFLRLDVEAETLYFLNAYGETDGDLSKATSADNQVFGGFTTDGVWLVGVECLTCISPAPLLLSVVEVTE